MSDAPQGVKTYHKFLPNLPEKEREELATFERLGLHRYAQARSHGLDHIPAWLIGLHADGKLSFEDMAQATVFQEAGRSEKVVLPVRTKVDRAAPKKDEAHEPIERLLPYEQRVKHGTVTYRFEPKEWWLTYRSGINDWSMSNRDKRSAPKAYAWACRNQDRLPTMNWDTILRELDEAGAKVDTQR